MIAISLVSHGHGSMVGTLVEHLLDCPEVSQIIVTLNIPESLSLPESPRVQRLQNTTPQGFGANHNAAFEYCRADYFCPINPDIQFDESPFPLLLQAIQATRAAMVAPRVVSPDGEIEDSVRHFPSLSGLLRKLFLGDKGTVDISGNAPQSVDWVAGMFMLFTSTNFRDLQGFDPRYFLYYEDVDICYRAWQKKMPVVVVPAASVIHYAQRDSHKKLRHLFWHLQSMRRYFVQCRGRNPRL